METSNIALHSRTVKGTTSSQTPKLQRNLHVQEQTLGSPRVAENWDFIVGVLVLGFSLQILTPQSDQREEVAQDTKEERGEGECVGSKPGVLGVPCPGSSAER